jgi:hypothetical protein
MCGHPARERKEEVMSAGAKTAVVTWDAKASLLETS